MSIVPGRIVEISGEWPGRTPKLPSVPGTTTISTSLETMRRSGVTSSNWMRSAITHPKSDHPGEGRDPSRRVRVGGTMGPGLRRGGNPNSWPSRGFRRHLAGLIDRLLDRADHVERGLGHLVVLAGDDALEALDRVFEVDEDAGAAGEHLGDMKGLRQEALDLARPRDGQPVLLGELVHAEDRDDVLQGFVRLQHALHVTGNLVVLVADHPRVEHARGRIE